MPKYAVPNSDIPPLCLMNRAIITANTTPWMRSARNGYYVTMVHRSAIMVGETMGGG